MSRPLRPADEAGLYWRDHLRDRVAQADEVLANLAVYRNALAAELELGTFIAVAEPADVEEIKEVVRSLLETVDWDKIWAFIK